MNQTPEPHPVHWSGYRHRRSGNIGVAHLWVLS
jgi:hypothetical protein